MRSAPRILAACSCSRARTVASAPLSPRVRTSTNTRWPLRAYLMSVPPHPASMSSGCAPMARIRIFARSGMSLPPGAAQVLQGVVAGREQEIDRRHARHERRMALRMDRMLERLNLKREPGLAEPVHVHVVARAGTGEIAIRADRAANVDEPVRRLLAERHLGREAQRSADAVGLEEPAQHRDVQFAE